MKVFSKGSKNNKSTPLLHSLTSHIPPKPAKAGLKPKGITKVTSYKNKLTQSTNEEPNIVMNIKGICQGKIEHPKTERSKIESSQLWRTEASVEMGSRNPLIRDVPLLLTSVGYKTCKSETNERSSQGSIQKLDSVVGYGTKIRELTTIAQPCTSAHLPLKQKPIFTFTGFHSESCLNLQDSLSSSSTQKDQSLVLKKIYANKMKTSFMNDDEMEDKQNVRSNEVGGDLRKRINHYKNTKINEYKLKPMAQEREKEREIERERLLQKEREIERERLLQKERQSRLSLNNFTMGKKLGRGRFGSVYMAEEKQTGMVVALKLINCAQVREEQMEDQIMEEIKLQLFMNHPNILKMYGYFRQGNQLVMILEYADEKCLFSKLEEKMSEKEVAYNSRQVIEALKYCHSESILHRDLKPENILLCQGVAKLADFGWAAYAPKYKRSTFCGTLDYVPPQILKGKYYDQKVDIWSLGVLIYEMSAGKAPFETYSISQAHVESKTMTRILDGDLSIPKTLSLNLQKLIESILMTEPEQRPSLEEIECSVWLQAYKDEGVEVCQEIWQFWVDREQ